MKTLMLRVCYLGVAVSTILASPGTEEPANAEPTDPVADVQPDGLVADVVPQLKLADADALAETEVPAPLAVATNAPAKPSVPLAEPAAPPNVKLSPAMADVVKLVQAGVGPDVLIAFITNSSAVFNVDSDVIVYLNDLGVTNTVITALIQHDSSPETAARKASLTAAQPLPPGVATSAPVSNVYPPAANRTFPPAGQTTYPGDFSSVTDTNVDTSNVPPAVATAPPAENVTVNYFYSSLAPYGSWVDVDGYGLCWRPTVAVADPYWRPYCDRGRWLWSDCGWYWYSDYTWGWAPFHYGRWCSYPRLGWIWVPGTVWSPSWVTWRYNSGYCGWAPLPPGCGYRSGIGLTWYGHGISVGFDFGLGWNCWSYVPTTSFCDWNVRRHCLPANRLHVVHNGAVAVNKFTGRNNSIVNHGIEPNTVASASRTKIPTMKIKDHALPTDARVKPERLENHGNNVAVVRPQLPKTPPAAVAAPVASRGTATRAKPMNLGSSAQATAPTATPDRNPLAPKANGAATVPRVNNNPLAGGTARNQGKAQRHDAAATTPPNSSARVETPNRPAATQPAARPPEASTPKVRQAAPSPMARNNVNVTPAPTPNAAPVVGRNLAPPSSQAAPRSAPAQSQAAPRTAPQQSAPATRNVSPMIPSYAEPRSAPSVAPPRAAAPSPRPQAPPVDSPQPSLRPQVSAPRAEVSRPSLAPPSVRSAPSTPSVSRSAPNGGGGGGNRSGGGGGKGGRGD